MANILNVIKEIEKNDNEPLLQKMLSNLSKNPNLDNPDVLKLASDTSFLLYFCGKREESLKLAGLLGDIPFTGNFDLWSPIEMALVLYSRISREKSNIQDAENATEKIKTVIQAGNEDQVRIRQKAFRRRMNGALLYYDEIKKAETAQNIKGLVRWYFAQFRQLCFMNELGGSETFTIERIEKELIEAQDFIEEHFDLLD